MDFGVAQRGKFGDAASGDAHLILEDGPRALVVVADGLGSGERAGRSAGIAIQGVIEHADAALTDILTYCHYAILSAGGVGVMMTLVRLDNRTGSLELAGVGNIRFLAHSRQVIQPITRYGYLGVRLPTLLNLHFTYTPGDAFVLHTDGISSRFHLSHHLAELQEGAQVLADRVLEEYGKAHDDATIVVIQT